MQQSTNLIVPAETFNWQYLGFNDNSKNHTVDVYSYNTPITHLCSCGVVAQS